MTSETTFPGTHPATDADEATHNARIAPRAIGHALVAGVAADLLLHDGFTGLAFPIWIAIAVLTLTSLTWRSHRDVPTESAAWLLVALTSACGLAWRDSGMLQGLDLLATAGAMGMASVTLGSEKAGLLAERFRDTVWAGLAAIRMIASGLMPNVMQAIRDARRHHEWESRGRRAFRSGLLAMSVLVVFGSLLRSADPIFASIIEAPDVDVGVLISHVVVAGWFAWLVSGWANASLGSSVSAARAPHRMPFALSMQDLSASLGVLNVLFATFMAAQLGWLFGGESFLRARTGLTAAEYARHGFFEMIWVVVLVVPLLVFTRAALVQGRDAARRHTLLALPLLVLLAGIIVSAAARMQLYVHFYGLTVDRFYPLVLMAWLMAVLVWLAVTVLRGRGRSFVAGVAVSAFGVLVALNVAAPDAIVAHFNAGRTRAGAERLTADLRHMTDLSGEAVDVAIGATLSPAIAPIGSQARSDEDAARCDATRNLLRRWGPLSAAAERSESAGAWRYRNAGEHRALRAVGANTVRLLRVEHATCSPSASGNSRIGVARQSPST